MTPCGFGSAPGPTCGAPATWTVSGSQGSCSCSVPACDDHAEHLGDAFTEKGIRYLLRPITPDPPASGEVPAVVPPVEPWWRAVMDRFTRRARRDLNPRRRHVVQKTKDKKPKKAPAEAVAADRREKRADPFAVKLAELAALIEKIPSGPWTSGENLGSTAVRLWDATPERNLIAEVGHDAGDLTSYEKAVDLAGFFVLAREVLPRLLAERKGS